MEKSTLKTLYQPLLFNVWMILELIHLFLFSAFIFCFYRHLLVRCVNYVLASGAISCSDEIVTFMPMAPSGGKYTQIKFILSVLHF